jgi:hypothetical protein
MVRRALGVGTALGLMLVVNGCGSGIRYSQTTAPPRKMASRPAADVEVFSVGLPERPYLEVGTFSTRTLVEASPEKRQQAVVAMRGRAGKVGCDGLVITESGNLGGLCVIWHDDMAAQPKAVAKQEPDAEEEEEKEETPREAKKPIEVGPAPTGAAGFAFKQDIESAKQACTGAKYKWAQVKGARYSCTGTPTDPGFRARSLLRFCAGRLCEINVEVVTKEKTASWEDVYNPARDLLLAAYGQPRRMEAEIPEECVGEPLAGCVLEQRAKLQATWWWDSGERVVAKLDPSDKADDAMLRITYTKWPLD